MADLVGNCEQAVDSVDNAERTAVPADKSCRIAVLVDDYCFRYCSWRIEVHFDGYLDAVAQIPMALHFERHNQTRFPPHIHSHSHRMLAQFHCRSDETVDS